jgi:hypothetical protein
MRRNAEVEPRRRRSSRILCLLPSHVSAVIKPGHITVQDANEEGPAARETPNGASRGQVRTGCGEPRRGINPGPGPRGAALGPRQSSGPKVSYSSSSSVLLDSSARARPSEWVDEWVGGWLVG